MSMINSLKMAMGITKAPAKTAAKEAAKVVSKPAAKVEAKAADAMEAQGRAMVKKYQKPEIEVVKMENPRSLRATSGEGPGSGDYGPSRNNIYDAAEAAQSSDATWGNLWE